ncbi:hypothetical protein CAP47_10000 [Psychroflexus sp. S27]|uniref:DUF262 domain-containing protein n=1 Tax=Psychroflexus sp. S27 TaxID=1982757 RepID=UPI000C2AD137|nr:DUF262 domain-containing protein [Psychroflexus sp. S27]PJX21936.1 hypothetical protein CAP47_10000 [Psychroflexus sp. S27]
MEISLKNNQSIILNAVKNPSNDSGDILLKDENGKDWIIIKVENNETSIIFQDEEIFEKKEVLREKIDATFIDFIESEQQGTEKTDIDNESDIQPFDPEDIKVHAKQFSLRLVYDMIKDEDIDLSPDFQRNVVWTSNQKSRLIESVLLRIPLPMFYFAEESDGRITIVDGLQRLTTIKEFMENKFPLKGLEYLDETCGGKYFTNERGKKGLDKKYFRWFNQTQFSVNVIDPSSPPKVKYDIFRRINTGGKPLNNQEIRNCLAGKGLRQTLRDMADLKEFKTATNYSIRSRRMDDQEIALRFILFRELFDKNENVEAYSGYMEASLNDLTEKVRTTELSNLKHHTENFKKAMINAEYLFGSRYAFRKIRTKDLEPEARKQLINKALFVACSVLLSYKDPNIIQQKNEESTLLKPLANLIENDQNLLDSLSYGTNSRNNLIYVFEKIQELIDSNLKK